jgi:hypothetical protein
MLYEYARVQYEIAVAQVSFIVGKPVRIERFVFTDEEMFAYDPLPGVGVQAVTEAGGRRSHAFRGIMNAAFETYSLNVNPSYDLAGVGQEEILAPEIV